jgi:excisionase family DNA binding protein
MNKHKQERQAAKREGLLDAREASKRLGLSFWTLYAWARTGRICYIQLGKRKLFDPKDIEDFINRHRFQVYSTNRETFEDDKG